MTKRSLREWDIFQLKLARQYSTMSKDKSTQVGAVVCDRNSKHVYGLGYNGLPDHMDDDPLLLEDREYKLRHTVHAEINALQQVNSWEYADCHLTLCVYPFIPCSTCAESILQANRITRVVTLDYVPERWKDDFAKSEEILTKAGIEVVKYSPEDLGFSEGDKL